MVFSSIVFLFLFLPFFIVFYFIIKKEYRNFFILIMSLIFYFWGEGKYVSIMLIYMIFNYIFGIYIEKFQLLNSSKGIFFAKAALILGLFFNIGLLFFFKYFNFIIANINNILIKFFSFQFGNPKIHLPIGISFFTFQAVSYIIDIYRKDISAQKSFINFSMYKALFPQLIAGPIVRYKDISTQIADRVVTSENFFHGIERFIIGLAKKVIIANNIGSVADTIFAMQISELSFGVAWLGVICYTLQIFFDFSGYSDMAIGLGKMLGFDFLENFNYPYISKSIREFWRRWHISLSTWFRDYLYLPLGGNRMGEIRNYLNLLFVFFLCGLWHGASWLFIIWGCWHGVFLILERTFIGRFIDRRSSIFQHSYTLLVVMIGWVFFRSDSKSHAIGILKNMFGFNSFNLYNILEFIDLKIAIVFFIGMLFSTPVIDLIKKRITYSELCRNVIFFNAITYGYKIVIILLFILSAIILSSSTYNPFIYFRF